MFRNLREPVEREYTLTIYLRWYPADKNIPSFVLVVAVGNRFRVAKVAFLPFATRARIFRGHQSRIVLAACGSGNGRRHRIPCRLGTGGIAASRASIWPHDHFCCSTIAPRRSRPTTWNELLPISMPNVAMIARAPLIACSSKHHAPERQKHG